MNRAVSLVIILLGLINVLCADVPDVVLHEKCLYPTVKVVLKNDNNIGGSGVIVRSSHIGNGVYSNIVLTSAHVISDRVAVYSPEYKDWSILDKYTSYDAETIVGSTRYDIAAIIFETTKQMPVASIDFDSRIYIGSRVFKIGYGGLDDARLDRGEITSVQFSKDTFKNSIRLNANTTFGDSGGPVFLESTHKIIAITKGIKLYRGFPLDAHVFASPISWIRLLSKEHCNAYDFIFDETKNIPYTTSEYKAINEKAINDAKISETKKKISELQKQIDELNKQLNDSDIQEIAPPVPE